jgi:hypothetical protein
VPPPPIPPPTTTSGGDKRPPATGGTPGGTATDSKGAPQGGVVTPPSGGGNAPPPPTSGTADGGGSGGGTVRPPAGGGSAPPPTSGGNGGRPPADAPCLFDVINPCVGSNPPPPPPSSYPGTPYGRAPGGPPPIGAVPPPPAGPSTRVDTDFDPRYERDGTVTVGLGVTLIHSGYGTAAAVDDWYTDAGAGLMVRWRPIAPFGIEGSFIRYDQDWSADSARVQNAGQASALVFFTPERVVSPYLLGGVTSNGRRLDDTWTAEGRDQSWTTRDHLWGTHAGVGLEVNLGQRAVLDVEGRAIGWLDQVQGDPTLPFAFQTTAAIGVVF